MFPHGPVELLAGRNDLAVDGFDLEAVEEAFGTSVVIAIALAAHAASQIVVLQRPLLLGRTVLAATVGMHDDSAGLDAPDTRHAQGVTDQIRCHTFAHGPTDGSP